MSYKANEAYPSTVSQTERPPFGDIIPLIQIGNKPHETRRIVLVRLGTFRLGELIAQICFDIHDTGTLFILIRAIGEQPWKIYFLWINALNCAFEAKGSIPASLEILSFTFWCQAIRNSSVNCFWSANVWMSSCLPWCGPPVFGFVWRKSSNTSREKINPVLTSWSPGRLATYKLM